jgi:hypothetical protein
MSGLMSPSGSCSLFQLFPYSYCSPHRALRRAVPFELLLSISLLPQEGRSLRFPVPFLFLFTCPRLLFTYKNLFPLHFCSLLRAVPSTYSNLFTSLICSLFSSVHYSVPFSLSPCSLIKSVPFTTMFTPLLDSLLVPVRPLACFAHS